MDPRVAEYILANRRKYTRAAIRQQLIEAGHDPATIDATWEILDLPDPDAVAGEGFWGRFWLFLIGANVAVFLIVGLATGMLTGGGFGLAMILAIALAIGALISWAIVAATRPSQLGRRTAMAIGVVIPLLFAFLIGGSCYALVGSLSGMSSPPPRSGPMELHLDAPVGLDGEGIANCFTQGAGTDAFSVFGLVTDTQDGRQVDVSLNAHPGEQVPASMFIAFIPDSPEAMPLSYTANAEDTRLELDTSPDGLSGTLRFESLRADPLEGRGDAPTTDVETLSGTFTWACE